MTDEKPKNLCTFTLMKMRHLKELIPCYNVILQTMTMPPSAACDAAQSIFSKCRVRPLYVSKYD